LGAWGLELTQSRLYFAIGLFTIFSIGSVLLISNSNYVAAHGDWQTIVPGTVAITLKSDQTTELSLQASAGIPHVERVILAGFGWLYEDGTSGYFATSHFGVRDSIQNPDHWHPHNIAFEEASGGAGSITHCITDIFDVTFAGIPINDDTIRVNARNSEFLAPFMDPPTAISFDIIPDPMNYVCESGVGIGLHSTEPAPAEEESKKGGGGGQGGNPNK